jgi:FtsH-binding integral membrane protein
MNDHYQYNQSGYGTPEQLGVRPVARLSSAFLSQAFLWMFLGLGLTAFVAFLVENNLALVQTIVNYWILILIVEMVLAIGIQAAITRLSATASLSLFFVYAALNGLTFGVIALAYSASGQTATVVEAFVSAAAMFAGAALYGAVTRRNLSTTFGIFAMATWGLLVAIVLNIFLNNSMLDLAISVAGVVIYAVLTASTVQKIERGGFAAIAGSMEKAAIWGALLLYIEFVGLFIFMLRLFGGGRR